MNSIHILLVEDNEGDILLTTDALEESKIINRVTVLRDGKAAIDFFVTLNNRDDRPDLILLDINLPKKSGHEVLQFIKKNEQYNQIPVIMLTTSSSERDILSAYKHYANCYITKPIDVSEFMTAIAKIQDFWINIVSIPQN
ncbi:response regulator [Pedobacter hartonius]|uniref:Response regulator receiver domain-containing protein n=1 Tax=Pedobacter hartonius TaxID=425514 RepID=A0A1H4GQJ8_9SPHI|nr:response regulator [Pedobacter hartonius]SEB11807.1 Response regulator receiver domain-containing protein [Pedobacter hartonius]